jgi:endonuclease/exonuclease/phosphatase family metal-dependent hydrolase
LILKTEFPPSGKELGMNSANRSKEEWRQTILYSLLFLIFFQLIADFVEAIYAFGLLGTGIPNEIASVLFFFSPVLLLIFGDRLVTSGILLTGELMLISRVAEPLLDTRSKMLVSGLGVGCFLLLLPMLLWRFGRQGRSDSAHQLGFGLLGAIAISGLLRAWGSGSDLSSQGWTQIIGWLLAIIAAYLLWRAVRGRNLTNNLDTEGGPTGFLRLSGLCLGIMATLVLLYFAFTSPNVIARWTGAGYISILGLLGLGMVLFSTILILKPAWLETPNKGFILVWNMLFIISLTLTILAHQIKFPTTPEGYPLYEPPSPFWAGIVLYSMLLLSPIVLLDFMLFTREIIQSRSGSRPLGGGFLIAGFFLLLIVFAQVFTTVYDYIPIIGPFFRDKFWLVYLIAGLVMILPVLFITTASAQEKNKKKPAPTIILAIIYLTGIAGALVVAAKPATLIEETQALRVLTYNIQQGYSEAGTKNFDGQLDLILSQNPDIIGLQESDTNRIAGGNSDVVRYYADRLEMYSYYGPKTVTGTFGIALLSRYPIENPHTFYMYSEGEQTATIVAQIRVGGKAFDIFVTHLGNGGPIVQQEAILKEIDGLDNIIAMGDFNFDPSSEQYRLTTATLDDAWLLKWPLGVDDQGLNPSKRIDHVFVSPGTNVSQALFLTQLESDHPALVVDITW